MKLVGFNVNKPDTVFGIHVCRWNCKLNKKPLSITINWNKSEVIVHSPVFSTEIFDLDEYTNAADVNFTQWIKNKINTAYSGKVNV